MKTRKRQGLALVATGALLMAVPLGSVLAQETPPPAEFLGLELLAQAQGVNIFYDSPEQVAHPAGQTAIPHAQATLNTGPTGNALASLAWPGPILGNLGGVIQATGGPPEANMFNYPVRAQAFTPEGPADARQEAGSGTVMAAHAEPTKTSSTGTVSGFDAPGAGVAGTATATATTATSGKLAVAESIGEVSNFSFGDGLITIESVLSRAKVTSNGVEATSEGGTVVTGVKVQDQPASIDERGLTIGDQTNPSPTDAIINQVANEALKQAGVKVTVTKPETITEGSSVSHTAGSVIIWFEQQQNVFAIVLGGASVKANAVPADPLLDDVPPLPDPVPGAVTVPLTPIGDDVTPPPSDPEPISPSDPLPPPPESDPRPEVDIGASPIGFFGGTPAGAILMVLVGSGLLAVGLRRVADDVLSQPVSVCSLERNRP